MSTNTDTVSRPPSPFFALVVLILAGLLGYMGVSGLDQGIRAARGEGTPGVFVPAHLSCVQHPGHESCYCLGSFTSEDGGGPRDTTLHAADQDTCLIGASIPAVDAGAPDRVYGPDGSREWILSALITVAALSLPIGLGVLWTRFLLARRRGGTGSATAD
ncbi:hypothetical protein [Nocardiopsis sp. LOL_012]|uniref:hypothetical protein n=1 Tax=Nocardiopsis sp. LOL_012 TaxID=3345409 RepID=UPI003A8B7B3E